jgi:hypothetical protein
MRTFILLILLLSLLPVELSAQVTQGGPPADDLRNSTTVNWTVDDASIIALMDIKTKKLMPSMELAINNCLMTNKTPRQIKDLAEFYQIFLTESFFKSLQKLEKELHSHKKNKLLSRDEACSQEDGVTRKCMQEKVDQQTLKDYLDTSVAIRYLELKLKLNTQEATSLFKVMQDLERK